MKLLLTPASSCPEMPYSIYYSSSYYDLLLTRPLLLRSTTHSSTTTPMLVHYYSICLLTRTHCSAAIGTAARSAQNAYLICTHSCALLLPICCSLVHYCSICSYDGSVD
jgi:hypothetical protein